MYAHLLFFAATLAVCFDMADDLGDAVVEVISCKWDGELRVKGRQVLFLTHADTKSMALFKKMVESHRERRDWTVLQFTISTYWLPTDFFTVMPPVGFCFFVKQ